MGWGGLKGVFDPDNKEWAKEYAELKELLTEEEYERARRSILDAHYTSVPVVRAIWRAMERLGFDGGRVLEPAMGIGHFFGLMPGDIRAKSTLFGVELDPVTGRIARQLYQKADIATPLGFQEVMIPDGYFDVAVGNPPFGNQRLYDRNHPDISKFSIHNFFFAKSLEKLRPGGLMGMVVSRYFLDTQDAAARTWIAQRAELIGAVRLPNTAFKDNAGTEVVTDVLFFQKRETPISADEAAREPWVQTTQIELQTETGEVLSVTRNRYYSENPQHILGRESLAGSLYRADEYTVEGQDFEQRLVEFVETLPEKRYTPPAKPVEALINIDGLVPEDVKVGGYFVLPDGAIARRIEDALGKRRMERVEPASEMGAARIKGLIKVRDALRRLMRAELSEDSTEEELAKLRRQLNEAYDGFVRKHGFINALANRRAFQEDPDLPLLESLEPGYDPGISREVAKKRGVEPKPPKADKADIFHKRVLKPYSRVEHAENPKDALVASLNERGGVDLAYMSRITGTDQDTLIRELKGLIYLNPEGGWETADQYLTGNVKAKLAQAKAAAQRDERFKENVEALEKVQPPDVDPLDISVRLGSPWVPPDVVEAFAEHLLGGRATVSFVPAVGRWSFRIWGVSDTANTSTWGTNRAPADTLIETLLNLRKIEIRDNVGTRQEPVYVVNEEETRAAQAKADDIMRAFREWIWQDQQRRERLARIYNDTYNTERPRTFDGSHLTLPGMSPAITLNPHQKDAVWRAIQDRTLLLDHVVGAGKTFTIISALMELRRLGVIRKPMVTVPNYLVRQWRDDFYKLYPNANVLAAVEKDFEKANRQRLFARIATGDWDAVIVPHSSFKKIGMPPETEQRILGEMLEDLTGAIEQMKRERGDRNVLRDMERIKERLEQKVKKLKDKSGKKDDVVTFDELGADALAVDEAHLFKNLFYFSSMQNVAGLGNPSGSGRAFDMFVKVRYLQERFAERGVVIFATGTPVSNSLVEMFTMQRYLQYGELKRRNIHLLDSWARVYGDVQQVYEVHPSGNGYRLATRFAKFVNMPELMSLYKSFADVITMRDLQAQSRKHGKRWPVPKAKGGKPILHVAERSPEQERFFGVPEFVRENGKIVFKYEELQVLPAEALPKPPHGERAPGLYVATPGKVVVAGPFESATEAEAERVRLLSEPLVRYNEHSILWKFENLKRLSKETNGKINALSITNEARKAGLDYRLIDPNAPDFPGSKINMAVDEVVRIYQEWNADRGTQLIFCDLSIPNSARAKISRQAAEQQAQEEADALESEALESKEKVEEELQEGDEEQKVSVDQLLALQSRHSVYDDVKAKLIARGIPEREIAFIHDYDTADKKAKLFKAMNAGEIRILIGSTEKMGAGMNVQERLVAIHHLDAPWRPSDLEQRNGRGFRQGNKLYERDPDGFELEEHRYATRQTYDTRMWQIIEHKATAIEQLRHANETARTIDDVAGEAASAADMKAAASGNPLILEEIKLRNEVQKLEAEEANYQRARFELQRKESWLAQAPQRKQAALEELQPWLATAERNPPMDKEAFVIEVGGQRITDRQKLLEPLLSEVKKALARGAGDSPKTAGRYRGFHFGFSTPLTGKQLYGEWSLDGKNWKVFAVYGEGEGEDFKPTGFIQRLDNAIANLARERNEIEERERQELGELEKVRSELAKPFSKKEELERSRREHGEVVRKLQAQGGAIELTPAMRQELAEALRARGIEPRFSRNRTGTSGMAVEDVRAIVEARTRHWKNRPNIHVLARVEDAPAELRNEIVRQGGEWDTEGAFHNGDIYLFAENLEDEARVEFVLLHEATHRGLRALMGDALDPVLMEIYMANAAVRRRAEQLRAADRHLSKVRAVEEALADLGGDNLPDSVWVRLVAAFRRFLRRLGFRLGISDTDIRALVSRALRYSKEAAPEIHVSMATVLSRTSRTEELDEQRKGYRTRVRRLIERLDAAMDPLGGLPDKQSYLRKRYETLGVIARVDEIAKKIGKVFGAASEADRQAVYDYLTTRGARPDAIQDETVRAQAVAAKRYIESVGDALVARGLLSEEAREAHRGSYLPRVYLKYLLSEEDWKALGSGKKPSDMGYLKRRKDIPEEVRRVILGEIVDPGFLSATAVAKPMRDMALLDWLQEISQNKDWVLPGSLVQWNGRTVSAYWLKEEAARLRRQANYQDEETAKKARALADRMDQVADKALGELASSYKDYKQIPNTARYGRLRGMWVRREIYDDIMGIHDLLPQDSTWFQSVFGYGGVGTRITQIWKASKVSLNPPAQVRNFVSNMVLLQLSGVPLRRIPGLLFRTVRQISEGGQYWQIAKKYGVTESTFSAHELYRIRRDSLDLERRARRWNPIRVIRHAAAVVLDVAGDAYQMMEAIGKTMKIMDAMERQGMAEWEAALEAQKWLFDYSLVPQSVRYARNAPIGVPFFTFYYKVLPRLVEVALLHPQRFLPWVGLYYTLAYAALAAFDDDDEDFLERGKEAAKALVPGVLKKGLGIESSLLDRLKKALPDWLQERGHVAILPFRDDQGRLQVLDLGYFFPWTVWTEALGQLFAGEFGKLPQTMGIFGGPVTDLVTAVKTGLDPFTDRPIVDPGDPPARQAVALINYFYDMMMPPIVSSRGFVSPLGLVDKQYGGKLTQALTGTTDKYGQPRATLEQAILSTVGVNLYALEPEKTRAQNLRRMAHDLEQVRIRLKFRLQDRSLTQEQREALITEYREELKRRYEEIGRYLEESRVPRKVSGGN